VTAGVVVVVVFAYPASNSGYNYCSNNVLFNVSPVRFPLFFGSSSFSLFYYTKASDFFYLSSLLLGLSSISLL